MPPVVEFIDFLRIHGRFDDRGLLMSEVVHGVVVDRQTGQSCSAERRRLLVHGLDDWDLQDVGLEFEQEAVFGGASVYFQELDPAVGLRFDDLGEILGLIGHGF